MSSFDLMTVRLSSGPRIQYASHGDPRGEPIIMLHGLSDSWFSFSRVLPLLPLRYRSYSLSLRGHGDSDKPLDGYTMDDFADDVVAFMDDFLIPHATIVGHSMSSIVARRVAERHPERVSRLILIGAAATPINDAVREIEQAIEAMHDPVPSSFIREFQASTFNVPLPATFFQRVIAESQKLPLYVWRRVISGLLSVDDTDDLHKIEAPTLLMWGELDVFFSRAEQKLLISRMRDARLLEFEGVGHTPHWERPAQFAHELDIFMRSASLRAAA